LWLRLRPAPDWFFGLGIPPASQDAATRECDRMRTRLAEDGKLEVAIERRCGDQLPSKHNTKRSATMPPCKGAQKEPTELPIR
jgi:hypothetical protein